LLQKLALAMAFSISTSWSSRRAPSKMPPQFRSPSIQVLIPPYQVIEIHIPSIDRDTPRQ